MEEKTNVPEEEKEDLPPTFEGDDDKTSNGKEAEQSKKAQTAEQNAYFASKRREKEGKTYNDGVRETLKVNKYTNEPLKDDIDLENLRIMEELEAKGEDPTLGFIKYTAERERTEKVKAKEAEERRLKTEADFKEFYKTFPDVNREELNKDENFKMFARGKFGNEPLTKIYQDYLKVKGVGESKKKPEATPSSVGGSNSSMKKSVKEMTDEEALAEFYKKYPTRY